MKTVYQFKLVTNDSTGFSHWATRDIAWSTVETADGFFAARSLACKDFEERGELRGQAGLSVDLAAAPQPR